MCLCAAGRDLLNGRVAFLTCLERYIHMYDTQMLHRLECGRIHHHLTSGHSAGTLQLEEEKKRHAPLCRRSRSRCFSLRDREYSSGLQSEVLARLHAP